VRRLRISIDDDILYDGELEKGCGNQVFDYGYSIVIGSVKSDSDAEEDNGKHMFEMIILIVRNSQLGVWFYFFSTIV